MIETHGIGLSFSGKVLFKDVSVKFTPGNCYGLIGANGAGKSTFLKLLNGDLEQTEGSIEIPKGHRISTLKQDQNAFNEFSVLETVVMGHSELAAAIAERDAIYQKPDFSDADGVRAGTLEERIEAMNGYMADSDAAQLLEQLDIRDEMHSKKMSELDGADKVRVLLAQALFGEPDILLLDEPTNNLDMETSVWLEEFLKDYKHLVIVVSHDRHFLNQVCTHIADLDFNKIHIYAGNYAFWRESSQLAQDQQRQAKKKNEDKIKELEDFVRRFSANASKAKQATSRKKLIDKLTVEDLPVSSRKPPYISFKAARPHGGMILDVKGLSKSVDGQFLFKDLSFSIHKGDKIAFVGANSLAKTVLFQILAGELEQDSGSIEWGGTITPSYFPGDNTRYFKDDLNLIDWLGQFTESDDLQYIRSYLGRMLFSGEDAEKSVTVLSGGEKARCMFSKMMMEEGNVLIFDEPTDHLDLEAISGLNDGLIAFQDIILFSSHDMQFVDTIANRIIEIGPGGMIDKMMRFDEYNKDSDVQSARSGLYVATAA